MPVNFKGGFFYGFCQKHGILWWGILSRSLLRMMIHGVFMLLKISTGCNHYNE